MRIKYPRTWHLPFSEGATDDDKTLGSVDHFVGRQVVVTEKLDGENTTIYSDGYCHARSLDGRSHESQTWVRALAARLAQDIPEGWRVCGENVYAKHSLGYDSLLTYFYVFAIYDDTNRCLSWDDTCEWAEMMGLKVVSTVWTGEFDADLLKRWTAEDPWLPSAVGYEAEGYVVRVTDSFMYEDFSTSAAKFVRADHVQTGAKHWGSCAITPNSLA